MKQKYRNMLISAGIVVVVLVAVGAILGLHSVSLAAYNDMIKEADLLAEQGDYYEAILKYGEAVQEQPKEEEGYIKLAVAYQLSGNDDYARDIINRALSVLPDSERLQEKQDELSGGYAKNGAELAINEDYLEEFSMNSYSDYLSTSSIEKITPGDGGSVAVRVKGVNADLVYKNTEEQPNAIEGGKPTSDSLPVFICFDNIMTVFGGVDQVTYDELESLELEDLKKVDHQDYGTAIRFALDSYLFEVECDEDGTIRNGNRNRMTVPWTSSKDGHDRILKGSVTNAVDGETIGGVTLTLTKSGTDNEVTTTSESNGDYEVKVGSGEYKMVCEAEDFIRETKTVYIPTYAETYTYDVVLSPDIGAGEARIVLNWGAEPTDLDSHLVGNGTHISFRNPSSDKADLDLDDTDGFGPETTTIYDLSGKYTFVVHDFTTSGMLANSEAEVTVYLPGQEPQTISISGDGDDADTWVVCELDNGVLEEINEIRPFDL